MNWWFAATLVAGMILPGIATAQATPRDRLTMHQWVHLAKDGALVGQVVVSSFTGQSAAVVHANVAIRNQEGRVLQASTDADGKFRIADVQPGIYGLVARGSGTFATAALHVLPVDQDPGYGLPSHAEISAARLDQATVQLAVTRYVPPNLVQKAPSFVSADLKRLAKRVRGTDLHQVSQRAGGMRGRIFRAGANGAQLPVATKTNVIVFQNGREVVRGLTDWGGYFNFDRMQPGQYSILAVGSDGIGTIGFILVDEQEAQQVNGRARATNGNETLVAQDWCCPIQKEFAMQVAPVAEVVPLVQGIPIIDANCGCGAPIPACGCGPCCEGVVEGTPVDDGASIVEGEIPVEGDVSGVAEGGIAPSGYAGYSGGGGFGGFGGGGGGGGGFGIGGLGSLGGLGGVLASTLGSSGGGSTPTLQPVATIDPPGAASSSDPGD